jgi:hypothetical protein
MAKGRERPKKTSQGMVSKKDRKEKVRKHREKEKARSA